MKLNQFSVAEALATLDAGALYPQLETLLGLTIAFVFFYHIYSNRLPGGYVGIALFFVLSGYLVALTVRKEHFRIPNYRWMRLVRLLPHLLAMLIACMAVGLVLLFASEDVQLARQVFKNLLFMQNFQLRSDLDYFTRSFNSSLLSTFGPCLWR